MAENEVEQSNIKAGGDVAGRDITKIVIARNSSTAYMNSLIERFKEEKKYNQKTAEIIEELKHYSTVVPNENVIGLKAKLEQGNRMHHLQFATETKEKFYKKLVKNEYSETAQEIYAFLLAEVYTNFRMHVSPQLGENLSESQLNLLIDQAVITPVQDVLSENVLKIFKDEINGMLYFLTGNCHIKWVPDVNL
jgi:ABC-3C protein